ncbi:MAG: PadR family transcriptional regulator [Alteraurantiacibacter sp.]
MTRTRRPSQATRAVLFALAERVAHWHHGYDLMQATGVASGTLYPMLMRLTDQGFLEAKWEPSPLEGRPPRHAYRLTVAGREMVAALGDFRGAQANQAGVRT